MGRALRFKLTEGLIEKVAWGRAAETGSSVFGECAESSNYGICGRGSFKNITGQSRKVESRTREEEISGHPGVARKMERKPCGFQKTVFVLTWCLRTCLGIKE